MLKVSKLSKSFSGRRVLNQVSFDIDDNQIVGLLGPNGAGKTTLMRLLTGFYPSKKGSILWSKHIKNIGYLPESNPLYPFLTPLQYFTFICHLKSIPKTDHMSEVKTVINSCKLTSVYNQPIGTLSKGFKQRVGLAAALLGSPGFLILDEPTSGLDPKQIIEFRNLIKDQSKNRAIIISTHILSEAKAVCDRIMIISKGDIVLDKPTSAIKNLEQKFIRLTNE